MPMEPRFPIKERGRGERILVVQTSYLGDVVLTTPVLAELRRRFSEAEVTVLCTPEARGRSVGPVSAQAGYELHEAAVAADTVADWTPLMVAARR